MSQALSIFDVSHSIRMTQALLSHIQDLLASFTNPDNATREAAEREYMSMEEKEPQHVVPCLIEICGSSPSESVRCHAILRLLFIFKHQMVDPDGQLLVFGKLVDLLLASVVSEVMKNAIVSRICECLPDIYSGKRVCPPGMDEFFAKLAQTNFELAAPFFIESYRITRNEAIYEMIRRIYCESGAGAKEMMIKMGMVRCQIHSAYNMEGIGALVGDIASLPDREFGACLNYLEFMFTDAHRDYAVDVLERILVMLLENASNEQRGELTRVQCLDFFGEFEKISRTCKEIILRNHVQVMKVIAMCLARYDLFPDLYQEAKFLLKCIIKSTVGDDERSVLEADIENLIRECKGNPFVCSTFLLHVSDLAFWPLALEFAAMDHKLVRRNGVRCLIMMVTVWRHGKSSKEFVELFNRTAELMVAGLSADNSRKSFYKLYTAIYRYVPVELNARLMETLLEVSKKEGCGRALEMCSIVIESLPEPQRRNYAQGIVTLGLSRYATLRNERDLAAVGRCMSDLSSEMQDVVMSQLPFRDSEDIMRSYGFRLIVECLGTNLSKYVKDILTAVWTILEKPLDVYLVPATADAEKDDNMSYMRLDGNYVVYSSDEIEARADVLELVQMMVDARHEVCLPYTDFLLKILERTLEQGYDIEIRRASISILRHIMEMVTESQSDLAYTLVGKAAKLLTTECDFISMRTLVGLLLYAESNMSLPDDLFVEVMQAVITASVNVHKLMCKLEEDDNYEDEWTADFLVQLVEDMSQLFDTACSRNPEFATQCFKSVLENIPYFGDHSASWIVRALGAYLWTGAIGITGFQMPERVPMDLLALISDTHKYLRQTGVLCLSNVVQSLPFSELTLRTLNVFAELAKCDDAQLAKSALAEAGEVLNCFTGDLDVKHWVPWYAAALSECEWDTEEPDDAYLHLLHLAMKLSADPGSSELVRQLVSTIVSALNEGVVGESFVEAMSSENAESQVVSAILKECQPTHDS